MDFEKIWTSTMEQAEAQAGSFGVSTETMRRIVETNLMSALHLMDDITEDTGRSINTLHDMLMLLNSEDASTREFLLAKFDHSGAEWWEATAAAYNKYLRYLERERHELEGMLDPANRHAEALRLATMETQKMAENQAKLNDTMQDTQWTMQDVLDDMATGFETANKNKRDRSGRVFRTQASPPSRV